MERLQNTETVLLAQVCAKPHTPDDHRSGEGILQLNILKRNPLFPRRLCSPNIMYVNANSSGLQKASNNRINAGIFRSKKLDRYSDGQFWVSAWLGQSPVIQPNTHLDVAVKVFCGCGSHPSSELQERRPPSTLWWLRPVRWRLEEQTLRLPRGGRNYVSRHQGQLLSKVSVCRSAFQISHSPR